MYWPGLAFGVNYFFFREREAPADMKPDHCDFCNFATMIVMIVIFFSLPMQFARASQVENPNTTSIKNRHLEVTVHSDDGSFWIAVPSGRPVIRSVTAAKINHHWIKSSEYPQHEVSKSRFHDALGEGNQLMLSSAGLVGQPRMICTLRLYDELPFGDIEVKVNNQSTKPFVVEAIRIIEAIGHPPLDLGGREDSLRIMSDTFSEDVEAPRIYDLGSKSDGYYRGVGTQIIYNRESKQTLFFGAVTSRRFVTQMTLRASGNTQENSVT